MRSSLTSSATHLAAALLATTLLADAAHAAPLLSTHVPASVTNHRAALVTAADPNRVLRLAIALPMRNQTELDALLAEIYNPASPNFRHYLTVPQFTEKFGPSEADYAAAIKFFSAQGLTITATAANRYMIDATGRVADLQRALHVKLGMYKHPTENRLFIAPDREPTLDLGVSILHIVGLNDFTLPSPRRAQRDPSEARSRALTGSGPGGNYLGSDIRAAYYGATTLTGAGQSLGLMELAPYNPVNITNYFTKFGPPLTAAVVPVSTDGSPATCTGKCPDGEQALDIEYAISMAPGLTQVQVYTAQTADSVLNRMASDNTSAQLSTSWGWGEEQATDDPIFKEMAAQGQSMLTASGDYSTLVKSGPWPEESAWITGVGGTDLTTTGPGGAWKAESGWADSAGGPSVDKAITIPAYQVTFVTKANGGSAKLRNVPDIGGDANFDNYECYQLTCEGGWGGTSFASPIWTGFIALANQAAASQGLPRVGFLNPVAYTLGAQLGYHTLFHDQISGTSGKFTAVRGFDLVTGFGSPNGPGLIDALVAPLAAP
jgi:subtilase family serine protease